MSAVLLALLGEKAARDEVALVGMSDSLGATLDDLTRTLSFTPGSDWSAGMIMVVLVASGTLAVQWVANRRDLRELAFRTSVPARATLYGCAALAVVIANAKGAQPFIYFQF